MPKKRDSNENVLLHKFVHKLVPGRLEEAIAIVKQLNARGIPAILSFLPVRHDDAQSVRKDVNEYYRILDAIHKLGLNCEVSLKLHQFGVYGSEALAERSVTKVLSKARKLNIFVWFDMELPDTIDATLATFRKIDQRYKNVGICLQAYLKRTEQDMHELLKKPVVIRLVKGFYKEHDFKNWSEVTKNYARLMEYLLMRSPRPCLATHDRKIISKAKRIIRRHCIANAEFQFFKGVCDDLAARLIKEGLHARIYVNYGDAVKFLVKGLKTFDNIRQLERIIGIKHIR